MKGIDINIFSEIKQVCDKVSNVVIISHRNPDGDAIGSSLGLYHVLKNMEKTVTVILPNDCPEFLRWLPGNESVIRFDCNKELATKIITNAELIFFLDFNDLSRISGVDAIVKDLKTPKVLIDHHPYPSDFTDFKVSTIEVSSTAELIFEFISTCNLTKLIDKNAAECLFTGMLTDTVSFSVNAYRPSTFKITSALLEKGIDFDEIRNKVFNNYSEERTRLLGHCLLNKMVVMPKLQAAYIVITTKDIYKFKFAKGDSEGFVNYPLSMKNITFSALFIEKKDHVKISFRSKEKIPVNEFAKLHFNGGGHLNAAGGEFYSTIDETVKKFEALLPEFMAKYV